MRDTIPHRITLSSNVRLTQSEDGAALLDVAQGKCFSLNPVGLTIWELIRAGLSVPQVIERMAGDFGISAEQSEKDVFDFIQQLSENHLLSHPEPAMSKGILSAIARRVVALFVGN